MAKVIRDSDNDNTLDSSAASSSAHALPFGKLPRPNDHDSVSAIACISDAGVEVEFLAPQPDPHFEPKRTTVLISEGSAGKASAQIAGTTGVLGVAWLEEENGTAVIKLRGITSEGAPFGSEITIGASKLNNHSFSIDGLAFAANGKIDAAAVGINVIWVESVAGDSSGIGRILMERYRVAFDEDGKPVELIAAPIKAQDGSPDAARPLLTAAVSADNDNAVWVGDESGQGFGGVFGFDPAITCLQTGDILVSWIGQDNHVRGKLYPPQDEVAPHPASPADVSQTESQNINSALADIGTAAPLEGDARRLQAVELAPGNFAIMWIALASSGLQLNGQIFLTTRHSADDSASTADWVKSKINPIALPRDSSGEFSLSVTGGDNPDLVVTYAAANSATRGPGPQILTLRIDSHVGHQGEPSSIASRIDAVHGRELTNDGLMETQLAAPSPHAAEGQTTLNTKDAAAPSGEAGTPTAIGSGFAIAATPDNETSPIIATTEKSLIIAWETSGSNPGAATISMKIYPSHGIAVDGASGTAIEVTSNADPDIAPAISGLGAGAVAVWIDASSRALTAQTFDENGRAFGPTNGIAVGSVGSVSEIAIASLTFDAASIGSGPGPEAGASAPAQPDDQFAIVWVENADAHGYGNIMLQRYGVPYDDDGHGQSPVALGRDGQIDGNNAPEQLAVVTDAGLLSAEGRAPQAIGLKDGALALAWVECTSSGEQIRGEVIGPRGGDQILLIDLFTLFGGSSRIEQDTRPILTSTDGNDVLISWLQPDGAGGFDLTTAHYEASGPDTWTPPEHAVLLQHFDSQPKDFSVVAIGDENVSLVVTWWEDSSGDGSHALGQRFDLMGNRIGDIFDLSGGKQQNADDMSDSAGLPDGRIVIVLTEENGTGDKDIVAYAFDTNDSGASAYMGLPETTLSALGSMTTISVDDVSNGQSSDSLWDGTQPNVLAGPENDAISIDLSGESDDSRAENWTTLQAGANAMPEIDNRSSGNTNPVAPDDTAAPLAISNTVISAVDPTDGITVDLLPDGNSDHRIFAIDGVAVETPADLDEFAAPVRVTDGFVQLRGDGLILFSPDMNFDGSATFDCAVTSASSGDATIAVTINVAHGGASSGTNSDPAIANDAKRDDVFHDYEQDNIFDFKKGYGNDAPVTDSRVIDMSSSGYATFEALRDAGALAQVGDDVVITLNPADPPNSDKVTLKFASLQTLEATDFKF